MTNIPQSDLNLLYALRQKLIPLMSQLEYWTNKKNEKVFFQGQEILAATSEQQAACDGVIVQLKGDLVALAEDIEAGNVVAPEEFQG